MEKDIQHQKQVLLVEAEMLKHEEQMLQLAKKQSIQNQVGKLMTITNFSTTDNLAAATQEINMATQQQISSNDKVRRPNACMAS